MKDSYLRKKRKDRNNKLIVIGLDGVSFKVLLPLVRKGSLPTFKRLLSKGVYGTMEGIVPPITPPSWETAVTGVNPGKHNVFDFFKYTPDYGVRIVSSKDRKAQAVWDYVGRAGKKSIVFNYPMGYPPPKIKGVFVAGMNTPGVKTEFTSPGEVKEKILKQVPGYQIDVLGDHLRNKQEKLFFEECKRVTLDHYQAFSSLLKKYQWDLALLFLTMPDRVHHYFFDQKKKLIDYYRLLDDILAKFQKDYPRFPLLIFSDHGMDSVKKDVFIEQYLEEWGLLSFKQSYGTRNLFNRLRSGLVKLGRKIGYRLGIGKIAIRHFPSWLFTFLVGTSDVPESKGTVNWEKTSVYFPVPSSQGLRINLRGREKQGQVSLKRYNQVREDVIKRLLEIRDPVDGRKIVKEVHKREEIYFGPYLENAQDLIIETNQMYHLQKGRRKEKIDIAKEAGVPMSADHSREGIFILIADKIKPQKIKKIQLVDVASYILLLLNLPLPGKIEGKIDKKVLTYEKSR